MFEQANLWSCALANGQQLSNMSQSTFKSYFNLTKKKPFQKQRKKFSINLLVVSNNNVIHAKVEKDEILIATPSHLSK